MPPAADHHDFARDVAEFLLPEVREILHADPTQLHPATDEMHPADLADVVKALPDTDVALFIGALPAERCAEIVEYLDHELRTHVVSALPSARAADIVGEMSPDERADVIAELSSEGAAAILREIAEPERAEVKTLLQYAPNTAGGLMTTEYISLPAGTTVQNAMARLKSAAHEHETIYAVYVLDDARRLEGVASFRDLIGGESEQHVADVMDRQVISVPVTADQEEVARVIARYDLLSVPVVGPDDRLLGIVTVDDIVDVLVEESTEDAQKMAAVRPIEQPYIRAKFISIFTSRIIWLAVIFVAQMFSGTALRHYSYILDTQKALGYFVPLIISAGGNAGSQSASLITRALAVGELKVSDFLRVVGREVGMGLALGLGLGVLGLGRSLMWGDTSSIAVTVGVTLVFVVMAGSMVGAMLPLVMKRFGFDPALASTPFVATAVDVTGIVIYFNIALIVMGQMIAPS
ncbi:MAG: magnesium transporter [Deltaproteobacteria bacterium]|nr:magnesium transporter [Deltaproteobacteria bacterium]